MIQMKMLLIFLSFENKILNLFLSTSEKFEEIEAPDSFVDRIRNLVAHSAFLTETKQSIPIMVNAKLRKFRENQWKNN